MSNSPMTLEEMMSTNLVPEDLLEQYMAAQCDHPEQLVLMRVGDFYEVIGQKAAAVAKALGTVLAGRQYADGWMSVCGIPVHSYDRYAPILADAGFDVVTCDAYLA